MPEVDTVLEHLASNWADIAMGFGFLIIVYLFIIKRIHCYLPHMSRLSVHGCLAAEMEDEMPGFFHPLKCEQLKLDRPLEILDISGPSAQFPYFPTGCFVTSWDSNPFTGPYLESKAAESAQVILKEFVESSIENLKKVDDESFDSVISFQSLCSVSKPGDVLQEILRILRPGGSFYFLEHTIAKPGTILRMRQYVSCVTWYLFFGKCHLLRDTSRLIENTAFSTLSYERLNHSTVHNIQSPTIFGVATK